MSTFAGSLRVCRHWSVSIVVAETNGSRRKTIASPKVEHIMNARSTTRLTLAVTAALALGLFAATPFQLQAQDKGSTKGGATKLMQATAPKMAEMKPAQTHASAKCKNCTDRKVTVRNTDYRGAGGRALTSAGAPTKVVTRHECQQCRNEWRISGHGKTAKSIPVHACVACN
jgi:hypothetical protein